MYQIEFKFFEINVFQFSFLYFFEIQIEFSEVEKIIFL